MSAFKINSDNQITGTVIFFYDYGLVSYWFSRKTSRVENILRLILGPTKWTPISDKLDIETFIMREIKTWLTIE